MKHFEYILRQAKLPWDVNPNDDEELLLLDKVPEDLRVALAGASNYESEVLLGDKMSEWISKNWRNLLPEMSKKFPEVAETQGGLAKGYYLHVQDLADSIIGPFNKLAEIDAHIEFCKQRGDGAGVVVIYPYNNADLIELLGEDDCLISPEEDKAQI